MAQESEDQDDASEQRDPEADKEVLEEAREAYEEDESNISYIKAGMLEDLKFGRMGEQWDQTDVNQRKLDGRPTLTINDLPASIRQVVNDARQNRPQIKVRPVGSGADVATAKVFSGLIKHIESISDADVAYDTGIDCAASMRLGFIGVDVDYACDDTFDLDIKIISYPNPLAVTWDSRTEATDSSDWRRASGASRRRPRRWRTPARKPSPRRRRLRRPAVTPRPPDCGITCPWARGRKTSTLSARSIVRIKAVDRRRQVNSCGSVIATHERRGRLGHGKP